MKPWGDRRSRGTRPESQLKPRVRKRRAAMLARWRRRTDVEWLGYHDRFGLLMRLQRLAAHATVVLP